MNTRSSDADADYKRRLLSTAKVFQTTPEEDLSELSHRGKIIAIARGKAPPRPAGGDSVFFIERGVIASLRADHENTKPVLTTLFGPGDIAGLQISLSENRQSNDVCSAEMRCLSNVSAVAIPSADLMRVARRCPELSQSLMIALAGYMDETAKLLVQSLHRSLELRLASLFSRIGDLLSGEDWRPTAAVGKISQSFAAEMLGVSREHVNRTLTMWEKSGLIFQNKSGEITIQNRNRLNQLASDQSAASQASKDGDWMWEIDSYLDRGLNQIAFNLAMEASKRAPRDMRFRHRAVLATARSGAMAEALTMIDKLGLKHDYTDEELGCLRPRILRDMAFSTDNEAQKKSYLVDSAEEYAKVFDKCRKNYSGLNAAYGYALLGESERARGLASIVSDITHEKLEPLDEDDPSYWLRATMAECKLLQNDLPTAAALFKSACQASDVTPGKKATTRQQLIRSADYLNIDRAWIDKSTPQHKTLFFSGPLAGKSSEETDDLIDTVVADVERYIEENTIGWACGALASGCDIAIAETLLEAGVSLNVYLPLPPQEFMKTSVSAFGDEWRQRFVDCMRAASSIEWNRRAPHASRATYQLGALIAMGKAIRHADELHTDALGFFAVQEDSDSAASLSIANLDLWKKSNHDYGAISGHWPKKDKASGEDKTAMRYAVTLQSLGRKSTLPEELGKSQQCVRSPDINCATYLFATIKNACTAALSLQDSKDASKMRIWLDVGVFHTDEKKNTENVAHDNLITASCRPLTDEGKIYASEAYASIAALSPLPARRFEYAGYMSTQEKLDPCPLYMVE